MLDQQEEGQEGEILEEGEMIEGDEQNDQEY